MHPARTIRIALVGMAALGLAVGIGRFAFTPLLPMMRADGLLDVTRGGWLASTHFLGYWLGALVAARVPCPPRLLLRLSLLAIGFGTLAMGLTESLAIWLALRFTAGLCSAWVLVLVSNYYVRHLAEAGAARLQGWVFAGVGGGIAAAGLGCLGFMTGGLDSLTSWQVLGAVALAAILLVSVAAGQELPGRHTRRRIDGGLRSTFDRRALLAYGTAGMGYTIPATYLPYMAREIVPDPLVFGWVWPVFGMAALLSTLLVSRRVASRNAWMTSQVVMAAGLMLPVLHPGILTLTVAGLCVGGTFMIVTMMGMKEIHRTAPPGDVMRHIAAMTASFATGQMLGPVFAGTLHDLTGGFAASFAATSAALLATALLLSEQRGNTATAPS
jgi:MFS family permease